MSVKYQQFMQDESEGLSRQQEGQQEGGQSFARNSPHFGLRARNGKKGQQMDHWPQWEKSGKMADKAKKWVKNGHFPIFSAIFPHSPAGAKIHCSAFFSHFGPRPEMGSVQGNRDRKAKQHLRSQAKKDQDDECISSMLVVKWWTPFCVLSGNSLFLATLRKRCGCWPQEEGPS